MPFQQSAVSTANATVYTFSAQGIGAATTDRHVITNVDGHNGTRTLSTVKYNTVSATIITTVAGGTASQGMAIDSVTSGTTADIEVTWSGGQIRCGIGVFTADLANNTATDFKSQALSATPSQTLTTIAGGFAVGGMGAGATGFTWTNLTEDYDETVEAGGYFHSGAHDATAGTSLTVSGTCSSSVATFIVASFPGAPAVAAAPRRTLTGVGT